MPNSKTIPVLMNPRNHTNSISRVFDLLPYIREKHNKDIVFASRQEGKWKAVSTTEYIESARLVSYALLKLGIGKGDTLVTITNNRPEFNFVDMGTLQLGAILVPLYTGLSDVKLLEILSETACRVIVVSTRQLALKIQSLKAQLPLLEHIISFDPSGGTLTFNELLALGRENVSPEGLQAAMNAVSPADPASIIYISGATTPVKGVILTHQSHVSNLLQYAGNSHMEGMTACVSMLPLAHSYERTINYCQQYFGLSIYYNDRIPALTEDLSDVKPELLVMVPLLLEKVFTVFRAKSRQGGFLERNLLNKAIALGARVHPGRKPGVLTRIQLAIANRFVFSGWREALGGRLKVLLCGGAALQPELLNIFHAARIPVYEGYGITEAGPLVSYNTRTDFKPYSLGKLMPGVEVKPGPDGELLVKSPSMMPGYFKKPAETLHALASDGWLHTGDLGEIDKDGFLRITGIKKEIFKLSSGIYVSPASIEASLGQFPVIRKAWVYGHNRDFLSAIIIPCPENQENPATGKNEVPDIYPSDPDELYQDVQNAIKKYNSNSRGPDQIQKFALAREEWTIENGLITEKGELNRSNLFQLYREMIDALYR